MATERIVITVKTYPQLSTKYGETVCTAGMREDGSWVRLYPIAFRLLDLEKRYARWDIVKTSLRRVESDFRPESYNPVDVNSVRVVGSIDTQDQWAKRRSLVFKSAPVRDDLELLIHAAHANVCSLATFKPAAILDFSWEQDEREWDERKLQSMRSMERQGELFAGEDWREAFRVIPKLPYKFRYTFRDSRGKVSSPQILDWEVGALFWNCLRSSEIEAIALEKVRAKFLNEFVDRDIHFFLGTTKNKQLWASNPWLIVGVFYPPIVAHEQLKFKM